MRHNTDSNIPITWPRGVTLILVIALAFLWSAVVWDYKRSENQGLEDIRRETTALALLFANQTTSTFRSVDQALLSVRSTWVSQPSDMEHEVWAYRAFLEGSILQIAIIGADGYLAYTDLGMSKEPIFLGDREDFKVHQTSHGDKLFVSRPVQDKVSGKWSIQLSRPIFRGVRFVGVIVISVDPNYFVKVYQDVGFGKDGAARMIRETGEIMARSSGQDKYVGTVVDTRRYSDPGVPLQGSFRSISPVDGIDRLSSYYRLPQYGLSVVVGPSVDESLASVRSHQRQILFAASCVTLLMLLLAWQMLRNLARKDAAQKELVALHEAVNLSEQRFRSFVENANDIVFELNLQGVFTYVSPNWTVVLGQTVSEVQGHPFASFVHPEDLDLFTATVQEVIKTGLRQPNIEYRVRHKNGNWNWHAASGSPLYSAAGQVHTFLGIARDITERKQTQERIKHMAQHDTLTGLANRALFTDRLQRAIAGALRDKTYLALMFIDLDKFKPVNDQFGHPVGDGLLQEVARRMLACVRDSDTVARVGGDEFMVLLRVVAGEAQAMAVAEEIRASIERPFAVEGHNLDLSCCIGLAVYPQHGKDDVTLFKNADHAMYQAKGNGRNQTMLYRSASP